MKATLQLHSQSFEIDLSQPIDISIPLAHGSENPTAWYLEGPTIVPVNDNSFLGSVAQGGSVNFNNIAFNPHAHGTHTECLGHITSQFYSVNDSLSTYFFLASLITVQPKVKKGDLVITKDLLKTALGNNSCKAVIIRTKPNHKEKLHKQWSHTNWPYLSETAAIFLRESGVQHLLVDTPSVDKEKDQGALLAHKAFWNVGVSPRTEATITEFVFVPNPIVDGRYLLNLQVAPMVNDAAPSRPVLYKIEKRT